MKVPKKLKRGLAELSDYFAQPVEAVQKRRPGLLAIQPPEHTATDPLTQPSLVTASIFSFSSSFQSQHLEQFLEPLQYHFTDVFLLTLKAENLKALTRPQLRVGLPLANPVSQRALALLDTDLLPTTFELLDHAIFAVEADTKQLMQVYQAMKLALSKNPGIHSSLFLVGNGAEQFSEFIYERFSEIVSNFLSHDLGFLGWMERGEICINHELLKEESDSALVQYGKNYLNSHMSTERFPAVH